MGRISSGNAKSCSVRLYEYCAARMGCHQNIRDTRVIDKFIESKECGGFVWQRFLVDYVAYQFSRWSYSDIKIMPNMIFGAKAQKSYNEHEREIDWVKLNRHGVFKSDMLDIVGIETLTVFKRDDFEKDVVSQGNPMKCLMLGIDYGEYCKKCKKYRKCLVVENHYRQNQESAVGHRL